MRTVPSTLLIAGVLAMAPMRGEAQDTLRVGQDGTDGSFLRNVEIDWRATRIEPNGYGGSSFLVSERYEVISDSEDPLLKMTQVWHDTLGNPMFTSVRVAVRRSMEYRAFHTGASPGGFGHLDFDAGYVSGMYAPAPEKRARQYALQLDERPFASMSGILIVSFPLEEGVSFVYPGFGWGGMTNPKLQWREVRVVGRESIFLPQTGEIDAWKVTTGNNTYWLSRQAPYFLRAESKTANGRVTIFAIERWSSEVAAR